MCNEILFILQTFCVVASAGIAAWLGPCALVAHICLQQILANLFVTKQIMLCGFATVTTDVFAVGSILGLNLLQERHGKGYAQHTILASFVLMTFYVVMAWFVRGYHPNQFDVAAPAIELLLGHATRITLASMAVYALVQWIDTHLYAFLRHLTGGRFTTLRTITSLICSQLLDTVLFTFAGLYGLVANVWHIIAVSMVIKGLVIAISTPCIAGMQRILGPAKQTNEL